jgi:hypothetical protein
MRRSTLVALLLAGAVLRVLALPVTGTPDMGPWKLVAFAASTDPAGVYGVGGTPPERRLLKWRGMEGTTEYPPLAVYELALVGRAYWSLNPLFTDSRTLNVLIKTPGTLAEALLVAVLLTWGRRRFGHAATWTAAAYWVNPAILLNGPVLGYLDPQMAAPAALALLAAAAGAPMAAGALAAAAVLTKAQAVFVLPALALFIWRNDGTTNSRALGRAVAGGLLATALILLPVIVRGALPNMVQAIRRLASHGMLSAYTFNVWWLATWGARVRAAHEEMGWWNALTMNVRILNIPDWERFYPNPKPLASALVVAAILWACWRARRGVSLAHAALLGAWCVYAYTMLGVQVHENHMYLAVPFAMIAAGFDPSLRPLAWTMSAMAAINMYLFYGLGEAAPPLLNRRWTLIDLSVVLSVVNVAIFVWATRVLLRVTRRT